MKDQLERFLVDVRETPRLVEELRSLLANPADAIRWASDRGFLLTPEDIDELRECAEELSDTDLDQVAGGDDAWGSGGQGGSPPPSGGGG
jgi:predicted ribosomally synthesized peptide with nif11-like leader